jgi:two-component system response regulator NreC
VTAPPLSRRETELLALLLRGFTSQAAADELKISVKTVETHRTHINRKLGVRRPEQLFLVAVGRGWLVPDGLGSTMLGFPYQRSTWDGSYETVRPAGGAA